ncbi:hypothetical protein EV356DRAFT_455228 [Viridothelium virens]|uniref:Transcription factor domain-containing protein n=1 Tax=Viridothelium virens TaxID=1048519 RepID=A0A6A6GVH8_VIRVR|nr:hypothetical protein EV356DRAFT_455228 [Viridothelium virens]
MAIQFIEQGSVGIGKSERRIIRSHVMRGKNAGRPRPSRRRQTTDVHTKKGVLTPPCTPAESPKSLLWNDLCLISFPQQLDSEATKLMHRWFFDISDALFPPQFCRKFDIIKSIWMNCVLADEAYFHSTLAISASYVDFFERKSSISPKTLHHISKAYELVNLRLSGPQSVSDSAIAAVVTLAIYQQVHHQHSTGLIHLNGLYRMIQLRGGIARLMKENRALALKPLRLDVELALQTGSPTLFHSDAIPANAVLDDSSITKQQYSSTNPWLSRIMLDVLSFVSLLNSRQKEGRTKLDPLNFTEALLSLIYRLLEAAPLGQPRCMSRSTHEEAAHLALLAFMTTLLPEYGSDQSNYLLLSARLESAIRYLQTISTDSKDGGSSLLLWTLFVAGISTLKRMDHPWLSSLILETCGRLDLHDWPAIRRQLCGLPWIFALHDNPGRLLWENTQRRSIEMS